jgi:hypothetical protein
MYLDMPKKVKLSSNNDTSYKTEMKNFSQMFEMIFHSAGYRLHTAIHPYRFPLLGTYENWTRLSMELVPEKEGRIPTNSMQNDEHVLDVLLAVDLDSFVKLRLSFVRTDLFPILFIQQIPRDRADYHRKLGSEFTALNVPVYTFIQHNRSEIAMDVKTRRNEEESPSNDILENQSASPFKEPDLSKVVQIYPKKKNNKSIGSHVRKDVIPQVIFDVLSNEIGDHHERRGRTVLEEAGGLVYNPYLDHERAPDGYYLCNNTTLDRLERKWNESLHTLHGLVSFLARIKESDLFVLVALEAKATIDTLQGKLDSRYDYFLFRPAPEPIRHLALVDGGGPSRAYITLLNLCALEAQAVHTSGKSVLDHRALARARMMGQKLDYGGTLIVYLAAFSTETIRDLPHGGNNNRVLIKILCKLAQLLIKVPNARCAANNEHLKWLRDHFQKAIEARITRAEHDLGILNYQPSDVEQEALQLLSTNPTLATVQMLQTNVLEARPHEEDSASDSCPQLLKEVERLAKVARKLHNKKTRQEGRISRSQKQARTYITPVPNEGKRDEEQDRLVYRMVRQKSEPKSSESSTENDDENGEIGVQPE